MTDADPNQFAAHVGLFYLVNPPTAEDVDLVRGIVSHIDFPLEDVVRPYLSRHFYGDAVRVQWIDHNNSGNATASWWGTGLIEISMQFVGWRDDLPFVFAHECGHMVDDACLTTADHEALKTVLHSGPGIPGMLEHSHSGEYYKHPDEEWLSMDDDYVARLAEDFADQFVEGYAPALWNGTAVDVPSRPHFPRFVHYTSDNDAVKEIVSAAADRVLHPPVNPKPKPEEIRMTRGKNIDEALASLAAWRRANPKNRADWLKVLVARKALRSIKPRRQKS